MNTTVAVYSHASRTEIREDTIRAFARVGMRPTTVRVQTDPPSQPANRRNAWHTLTQAYAGRPVLLLEDDVTPANTLPAWIEYLEAHEDRCVTLFAIPKHFYPTGRFPKNPTPTIATIPRLEVWYGSQAVWMPPRVIDLLLEEPKHFLDPDALPWEVAMKRDPGGPWDRALREVLQIHGETMGHAIPNVVQHKAPPSVVNRPGKRQASVTFDSDAQPPTSGD